MDLTAVKHAGGEKGGGEIESLRDRKRQNCSDSVVSCLKVAVWSGVVECCE